MLKLEILFSLVFILYCSICLLPFSLLLPVLSKQLPDLPSCPLNFIRFYSQFKMVYFDKSWKNILTSALNNDRCSPVCVPLCRRSRRGVTPTCGRLARRSKTLRRTSGMDSNSCCCWRSSQVTPLYDLESVNSTENEAQRSDFFNTCL